MKSSQQFRSLETILPREFEKTALKNRCNNRRSEEYNFLSVLGNGSYGTVFEVKKREDMKLEKEIDSESWALKTMLCSVSPGEYSHDFCSKTVSAKDMQNMVLLNKDNEVKKFECVEVEDPESSLLKSVAITKPFEKRETKVVGRREGSKWIKALVAEKKLNGAPLTVLHIKEGIERMGLEKVTYKNLSREIVTNLNISIAAERSNSHRNLLAFGDFWYEVTEVNEETKQSKMDGTLVDYLQRYPDTEYPAPLIIMHDICRGLEILHSNGIAHEDLHNENVMFREKVVGDEPIRHFAICDFGRTKYVGSKFTEVCGREVFKGKELDMQCLFDLFVYILFGHKKKYKERIYRTMFTNLKVADDHIRLFKAMSTKDEKARDFPKWEEVYKLVAKKGYKTDIGELREVLNGLVKTMLLKSVQITMRMKIFGDVVGTFKLGEEFVRQLKKSERIAKKRGKELKRTKSQLRKHKAMLQEKDAMLELNVHARKEAEREKDELRKTSIIGAITMLSKFMPNADANALFAAVKGIVADVTLEEVKEFMEN